ncbi:MAG: metallopeptidase family protein [Acidimicrobiales bacterium]
MIDVSPERFDGLVADAVDSLPEQFASHMDNVVIVVEAWPDAGQLAGRHGTLLGLYEGIDLTRRSPLSYTMVAPDKITIFQGPISARARTEADLVALVRTTVIHEIAHHFGISDERLRELGWG